MRVLDLHSEHDFPVGIERPGIGAGEIGLLVEPPDPGGKEVAAHAPESFLEAFPDGLPVNGVADGPDKFPNGFGVAGPAEVDAVDAGGQRLLDHPAAGPHGLRIEAQDRKGDNHGWSSMAARGWSAVDQTLHE